MKIYLVGGYVRDSLLGLPVKDKDWVVIGATQHAMLQLGYKQVGKSFPVFLHPKTKEEYALARKETKAGKGYHAFLFDTSQSITLKEDLFRRDLTINALAMDSDGKLIDYFQGQSDLKNRCLRHVSKAFVEDPLRVLRVARFAAYLGQFSFYVHKDTMTFMRKIVDSGELSSLSPERICREVFLALNTSHPSRFIEILLGCNAWEALFPEFALFTSSIIDRLKQKNITVLGVESRFALMCFDLSMESAKSLTKRLHTPTATAWLAVHLGDFTRIHKEASWNEENILYWIKRLDALRNFERFKTLLDMLTLLLPNSLLLSWSKLITKMLAIDYAELASSYNSRHDIKLRVEKERKLLIGIWLEEMGYGK